MGKLRVSEHFWNNLNSFTSSNWPLKHKNWKRSQWPLLWTYLRCIWRNEFYTQWVSVWTCHHACIVILLSYTYIVINLSDEVYRYSINTYVQSIKETSIWVICARSTITYSYFFIAHSQSSVSRFKYSSFLGLPFIEILYSLLILVIVYVQEHEVQIRGVPQESYYDFSIVSNALQL